MIFKKSAEEIELLRKSSLLVGITLAEVATVLKPGMKTIELDALAEKVILDHGAKPGFKGYRGFAHTLCISVNEQIVHGIPSDREILDGDIVSIDCGTYMNGFYGDSAYSFAVGKVDDHLLELMKVTKESLFLGISAATVGNRVGDIGYSIQSYVESFGYSVVRELVGHGLGKNLHEEPEVPNFGRRGKGKALKNGMVLAIEPMVNLGSRKVIQEKDGWTIRTADKLPSVHFEHDVAINGQEPDILSSFEKIEAAIKKNENLVFI